MSKINSNNKRKFLLNVNFYQRKNMIKKEIRDYVFLIISSLILTLSYDYFISSTTQYGIFPSGVGALARIAAIYTSSNDVNTQNLYYYIYLFLLNVPLFIFSILKLNVKFSLKTILYIILQLIFNAIIMSTPFNPNKFHILVDFTQLQNADTPTMDYQLWLFAFSVLGGITYGYACGLVYSVNGSTGGTDFVSMYFSIKKKKSIGNINKYINFGILIFVMIMQALHISTDQYYNIFHVKDDETLTRTQCITMFIFGPSLFSSLLIIFIQTGIINITYPKYQYRTLFVITKKSDLVIKSMRKIGTVINDISVWDAVNTQLDEKQDTRGYKIIMSTIALVEYRHVKRSIMISDPYARIFLQKVDRIAGNYQVRNSL